MRYCLPILFTVGLVTTPQATLGAPPAYDDPSPKRYDLTRRASQIDPRAREHSESDFLFAAKQGKILDLQHAAVDTRVPPRGKLSRFRFS